MSLKMLREHLCTQASRSEDWPREVTVAVQQLTQLIDFHRPLGPDGSHDDRHTATCGCEDKP